jgi:4'-phosphopantetheinyl transferase EntD
MTRTLTALAALAFCQISCQPGFAQKLVDPSTVAPEYREAAEKRRAEQLRQRGCAQKADAEKIMPRERTAFLNQCLDEAAAK